MNELTCPKCKHTFFVDDYDSGDCPNCGKTGLLTIPRVSVSFLSVGGAKTKIKMNNWIEYGDIKLEDGAYYELAFWNRTVKYSDGVVVNGSFIHQGILKFDDGFKVNGYWLRPTPTHIRKIELTTPDVTRELANER